MRERLPERRRSETFDFEVVVGTATLKYTATVGFYKGRPHRRAVPEQPQIQFHRGH
jgi:hypothetical protein